jgi:hemin uptake protein HemP
MGIPRQFQDISSQLGTAMTNEKKPDADDAADPTAPPAPVVDAKNLFGASREIVIEHDGERYRLRITRRGKLILQK